MPRFLVPLRPMALAPLAAACGGALLLASCNGNIGKNTPGDPGSSVGGGSAGAGGPSGVGGRGASSSGSGGPPAVPGVLQSGFARLTRAEYRATIKDAFGVDADVSGIPEDGRVGPYTSNIAFASNPVQPFLLASEDLAAPIVPGRLPACTAATASTCISTSYGKPFERLFVAPSRRPRSPRGRRCSPTSSRPA